MHILENVPLKLYSTMRLGGNASYVVDVKSKSEVRQAELWAEAKQLPVMMIGGGSNIIWRDDGFRGLLMVNKIPGFKKLAEDGDSMTIWIGAGKTWDKAVAETVALGLTGIEALSLIPGITGATPIQNVGAYGQEVSQTMVSLEAYDRFEKDFVTITNDQCAFSYRMSRFKSVDKGRFLITSVIFKLRKGNPVPPFYESVQSYFDEHGVTEYTPAALRKAVVAIRSAKLPDPAKVPNTGSFFANPIVDASVFKAIKKKHKEVVAWPHGKEFKLSAGWLIEAAGFKGKTDRATGMRVSEKQALVIINESAHHTSDLLDFRQKIMDAVQKEFGITLQQEPELVP
jgi:UDP-N-acetylmuramate dehydrogenase